MYYLMNYAIHYAIYYVTHYSIQHIMRVIFIILFHSWETLESSKMQRETEKEADLLQQR